MAISLREPGSVLPAILGGGDGPRGCMWNESVCTQPPSYETRGSGEPAEIELFCARHYALSLARFFYTHYEITCHRSVADHYSGYGPTYPRYGLVDS